jgi:hypothetical protein
MFDRYWNSSVVYPVQEVVAAMTPAVAEATGGALDELVTAAPPEFLPQTSDPLGRASVDYELRRPPALSYATAQLADTPWACVTWGHARR